MIKLIQERLAAYEAANQLEKEQAIKEILQEIALYGLWRAGFFDYAAFQGGTSLRILHGMSRFSEDLDFILKIPDPHFSWPLYLKGMRHCFEEFGLRSEVLNKSRMDQRIKKALIKDNSISSQLNLSFYRGNHGRKQKIKRNYSAAPHLVPFCPSRIAQVCLEGPNESIWGTPEQLQPGVKGNFQPTLNSYDQT